MILQTLEDVVGKRVAFTSITVSSPYIRPMGALVTFLNHVHIDENNRVTIEKLHSHGSLEES